MGRIHVDKSSLRSLGFEGVLRAKKCNSWLRGSPLNCLQLSIPGTALHLTFIRSCSSSIQVLWVPRGCQVNSLLPAFAHVVASACWQCPCLPSLISAQSAPAVGGLFWGPLIAPSFPLGRLCAWVLSSSLPVPPLRARNFAWASSMPLSWVQGGGGVVVRGWEGGPSLVTPEQPSAGPGLARCSTTFLLSKNPFYLLY